jgi:hypothetical protein
MTHIYHVTRELAGFSRRRALLLILFVAGVNAAIFLAWNLSLRHKTTSGSLFTELWWWMLWIGMFVSGLLCGFLIDKLFFKSNLGYDVIVSDDRIIARYPWIDVSVERDDLRTVYETRGNILAVPTLRLSNHGRLGALMMGGIVAIPRALPEYESIKGLALSWINRRNA